MSSGESRLAFFRQSGWMALATIAGGVFNMVSMFIAQRMPEGDFHVFDVAMSALGLLGIPAAGLMAAFAQQAAAVDTPGRQAELAVTTRWAVGALSLLWLGLAAGAMAGKADVMNYFGLHHTPVFLIVLVLWLVTLMVPIPMGILQGRQNFLMFGAATCLNGLVRCALIALLVLVLKQGVVGTMVGVLAGTVAVVVVSGWPVRDCLAPAEARFDHRAWMRRLIPAMLATGACSMMSQADAVFGLAALKKAQPHLPPDILDGFSAVRRIGLAMIFAVGGLSAVMFPKLARSFRRTEKTDVLRLSLLITAGFGGLGALVATIFPELPLWISPRRLWGSRDLVPWYCWAQVPMALANLLVWNLVAREAYRAVWVLTGVAAAYVAAFSYWHDSLQMLIQVLLAFAWIFFAVAAFFTWQARETGPRPASAPVAS